MDTEPSFELERPEQPENASDEQYELYTYVYIGEQLARVALTDYYLNFNT